jgi:hypothetical protein
MKDERRPIVDVQDDDVLAGRGGHTNLGALAAARLNADRVLDRAFLRNWRLERAAGTRSLWGWTTGHNEGDARHRLALSNAGVSVQAKENTAVYVICGRRRPGLLSTTMRGCR